jgi:hypothetical protein
VKLIDGNGHTPGQEAPGAASFDEQLAATREAFAKAQAELATNMLQIAYELGRLRGLVEERDRHEAAG